MKKAIVLPVSQAKEGRETSALEKSLIRFFEWELEVKLTRREMWRSVSFFARSLAFLEKNPHLCNALHLKQATRFANKAVGIFCVHRSIYSSVPCGALMRPLPVSGGSQRGAELFLFPLRLSINILFHLNDFQNEKNSRVACIAGKRRAKNIGP